MSKCILIVDDEEDARSIAQLALQMQTDWTVLLADCGQAALTVADAQQPDVILLDMMMPDMDGRTTLQKLKANQKTRSIPVILVTAKVQAADQRHFDQLDVAAVFAKPYRPLQLADEISKALGWEEGGGGRNKQRQTMKNTVNTDQCVCAGKKEEAEGRRRRAIVATPVDGSEQQRFSAPRFLNVGGFCGAVFPRIGVRGWRIILGFSNAKNPHSRMARVRKNLGHQDPDRFAETGSRRGITAEIHPTGATGYTLSSD
jgi:CheY-like chemotaxis protein